MHYIIHFLLTLSRWCWCSRVQELSLFKTWCRVYMTTLTAGHGTHMNPAGRGSNLKVPHMESLTPCQEPRVKEREQSQECFLSKRWSSLTAHGTKPTRSALMRGCKVDLTRVLPLKYLWGGLSCLFFTQQRFNITTTLLRIRWFIGFFSHNMISNIFF